MSCLKSFTFLSSANESVTTPQLDTWGTVAPFSWLYQKASGSSTFNIQGYKNVNIHAIEAVGDVGCLLNLGQSVVVNDWAFYIQINGQNPLVSGNLTVSPNNYSIQLQATNPNFSLSRYNPKLTLADPITSATSIQILGLKASGLSADNATTLNIAWNMNFVVYYTYEGE
jgi:hypothetical protein